MSSDEFVSDNENEKTTKRKYKKKNSASKHHFNIVLPNELKENNRNKILPTRKTGCLDLLNPNLKNAALNYLYNNSFVIKRNNKYDNFNEDNDDEDNNDEDIGSKKKYKKKGIKSNSIADNIESDVSYESDEEDTIKNRLSRMEYKDKDKDKNKNKKDDKDKNKRKKNEDSDMNKHLYDKGWDGKSCTLTILKGGAKFWFPHEKWDEFNMHYAFDMMNNDTNLYFNQRLDNRQNICKLFLDLDFKGNTAVSEDYIIQVCKEVHKVICKYYPNKQNPMLVCKTIPKRIDRYGKLLAQSRAKKKSYCKNAVQPAHPTINELVKRKGISKDDSKSYVGCHLHFPDIVIHKKYGRQLISSLIAHMEDVMPTRDIASGNNPWNSVFDVTPLENFNIRMFGSRKYEPCQFCREYGSVVNGNVFI